MALQKFTEVVGLDIDDDSIRILRERFEGNPRVRILKGRPEDLLNELASSGPFDGATLLDVIEHVVDGSAMLESVYELLKPGGFILTTTPNWYDRIAIALKRNELHKQAHSSVGWAKILRRTGFAVDQVRTVSFPIVPSDFLCRHAHIFGACVVVFGHRPTILPVRTFPNRSGDPRGGVKGPR